MFIFLSSKINVLLQIHLILFHKQQELYILFCLFRDLAFQTLLTFIPSIIGTIQAQTQKWRDIVVFNLIDLFEQLNQVIAIGHIFYYVIYFCLSVIVNTNHVLTATEQLNVFKFLESIEIERTQRFANPSLHILYFIKITKMKVLAITHKDTDWLFQIKSTLVQKWVSSKQNPQKLSNNFDEAINGKCDDFAYAILVKDQSQILLIASLFKEYKLTRGLCETYHLQIQYKNCTTQQELYFQREIVKLLPVYKVTGLAVTESPVFHPHQVLMDIRLMDQTLKGNL